MNDYIEINHLLNPIRKRWWILVVAVFLATGIGYLVGKRQVPVYEAKTTILVGSIIRAVELERTDILTSQLVASTYVDIIRSQPIMEGVVESLQLNQSWQSLKKIVNAQLVEGTQIINIYVESSSPEQAKLIADETARQMIQYNPNELQFNEGESTQSFVRQQLESLQSRLENGQGRLASLESELITTTSTDQLLELQNEVDSLEILITEWENNYTQLLYFLESNQSPTSLTIIEPAQTNSNPVRPQIRLYMLIAGGGGLILALGLILLLDYLDDNINSIDELNQGFDLVPLGSIPKMMGKSYESKLGGLQDHLSSTADIFRLVGVNLQLFSGDDSQKALMITSPNHAEGKSLITASLGIVLAQAGLQTIIVDANLRRPVIHEIFNLKNRNGLMELLSREKYDIGEYLQKSELDNLKLLPIGVSEINPTSLLMQEKINHLITTLKEKADVVLLDTSSVLDHADSIFLSAQMDDVILVVAAKRTKKIQVEQSIQNLEQVSSNLSGVIFNRFVPGKISSKLWNLRSYRLKSSSPKHSESKLSLTNKLIFTRFNLKRR